MSHLVFALSWQHKYHHSRADLSMVYCKQAPRDWQLIRIFSLMNKNTQHFYCCSLVLGYSFRSWLQSTFPLIQFWPSLDTELFVNKCNRNIANELYLFLVNIAKPRRFKDMFLNRINNCCPSYATKACPDQAGRTRSRQNQN